MHVIKSKKHTYNEIDELKISIIYEIKISIIMSPRRGHIAFLLLYPCPLSAFYRAGGQTRDVDPMMGHGPMLAHRLRC